MRDAIDFAENYHVKNIIIVGGEDALSIANILVEKNIPVILLHWTAISISQKELLFMI